MDLSASILVGRSTRMGRDKAFLTLDAQTFVGRLAHEFSGCCEVFISTALKKDFSLYGLPVVEEIIRQMSSVDVIMIEGMKNSSYPKVEVIRSAVTDHGVCDPDTLLCMAADTPIAGKMNCPVFDLNDTEGILDCILKKLCPSDG